MRRLIAYAVLTLLTLQGFAQRSETLLENGWFFHLGDVAGAETIAFDASAWESVRVPHDWAITGPFDVNNDLQNVAVTQNFEKKASLKTGRTGGLPYIGVGWYRRQFDVPAGKKAELVFLAIWLQLLSLRYHSVS